jgi:hypothetical protein
MDNQQVPKADSKFQKIARKNHRKWKIRLLSKGGQKADSGGGPYSKKPDYNRAKSAPPGFGGSLEEAEQLDEVIRKKDGKYCLFSKKTNRNLGCYPTRAGAMKREKQVQYFKHLKENQHNEIINEELYQTLLEEGFLDMVVDAIGSGSTWVKDKLFSLLGVSDEKEKKGILGFLTSKLDTKEEVETAEKNEKQIEQELKDYIQKEKNKNKGKKALIYGHSQAGGVGLGLKSALKSVGYDVNLVIKNSANDSRLLREIGDAGDPKQYDKVYLFVGGNSPYIPKVDLISSMINLFGPEKTSIVLPPTNIDKYKVADIGSRNKANKEGILQRFGGVVKVYIPYGHSNDFSDGIHMNHNALGTKRFIQDIFAEKPSIPPEKQGIKTTSAVVKNSLSRRQREMAGLIEKRFIEAGLSKNLALAAIVNSYYESSLNPSVTGDRAEKVDGRCARQVEEKEGPKSPCGGGLFGIHSCGGMGGCRATGNGMSIEDIKDPEKSISTMINYIKRKGFDKKNLENSVEDITYNFCYSLEVPKNRLIKCRNRANSVSQVLEMSNLTESKKITIKFGQQLTEGKTKGKEDRCTRIAKSKYDAWPSAYASGAVVKCRQGKIWKNIKEEEELDETKKKAKHVAKKALALWLAGSTATTPPPDATKPVKKASTSKDEIKEEWSDSERKKRKANCSNPKGFTMKQFCKNQRTKSKEGQKKNEEIQLNEKCWEGYTQKGMKTMFGKKYPNCVKKTNEAKDPKVGTGKKPEGSDRRLYTDENPKDTVSVKFSTAEDIRDTLSKESFKSKPHARQSQIINLIHQRVRAAYENAKDPEVKSRLKIALDYAEKRKEALKELDERKLGKPSSETNLGDWFKRKGAPGKGGGWVDCNTCRDGKCKPCGRQEGEKRSKYPRCRPTPSQCKGYKRRGDNLQKEE